MIRDGAAAERARLEPAFADQAREKGRMVLDRQLGAERPILGAERVQGVRVRRDDALERIALERRDVAPREVLERRLVAEAPREVAAIELLVAEHGEVDVRGAQQARDGAQRALVAQLEAALAYPPQHVAAADVAQAL